jgi:hypothetical protein
MVRLADLPEWEREHLLEKARKDFLTKSPALIAYQPSCARQHSGEFRNRVHGLRPDGQRSVPWRGGP